MSRSQNPTARIMQPSRFIRRFLSTGNCSNPFERMSFYHLRAVQTVWAFYLVSAVNAFAMMPLIHADAEYAESLDLIWPVLWIGQTTSILQWADSMSVLTLLAALCCCWRPDVLAFRALFAIGLMLCGAFWSSFGGINHVYHAWAWVAFVLTFLPTVRDRPSKLTYLLVISTAQGLLLSFYSLAGSYKLIWGIVPLIGGRTGNLSPDGFAYTLADRVVQTNTQPLLADLMIKNPYFSYPFFLALIYVQFVAVVVVYRPRLHVAWGLALLGFHIGTWLLMEIASPQHFLVILTLIVFSPFRSEKLIDQAAIRQLPILGRAFRLGR